MANAVPAQAAERMKIGLALSGGGARGGAHVGVLRELERQNIPIDYIAGTSFGAIIGAMHASGATTQDMERVLIETDWGDIFKDPPPRKDSPIRRKIDDRIFQINKGAGIKERKLRLPTGLIQGQKIQLLLDKIFLSVSDIRNFDQLPVPFRAVAADIENGEPVVIGSGSLSTAVRASMSVPAVFATVEQDGRYLVDGGIANNMPIDVVRDMGADIVIAVDIGTPLHALEELDSVLNIAAQLSGLLTRRNTEAQIATLTNRDVLITPELGRFSSGDFANAATLIPKGVEATLGAIEKLEPLGLAAGEYSQHVVKRGGSTKEPPSISFIRIENDSKLADEYIYSRLRQKIGEELDFEQLERDISVIYGLGIFQNVDYTVVEESGTIGLVVDARQKAWGPNYLQFGLGFSSNGLDDNDLELRLGYTVTPLNIWNGEWQTIVEIGEEPELVTELNQPLGLDSPYFVNGKLAFTSRLFNIFDDDAKINQTRSKTVAATAAIGREFGHGGDLRVGVTRFVSNNDVEIGTRDDAVDDVDGGEFLALYRVDTLDDASFPTRGVKGFAQWLASRSEFGADDDFDQAKVDLSGAASFGSHTLLLGARYFSTLNGDAPVQSNFRVGGLFELPGFAENELSGQNLYLLRAAYQRRLHDIFSTSPYLGITLQYGQVFRDEDDIDLAEGIAAGGVWLGWKSVMGPIYWGYGRADTGDQSIYVIVGSQF